MNAMTFRSSSQGGAFGRRLLLMIPLAGGMALVPAASAQNAPLVTSVTDLTQLQSILDSAWTNRVTSALYPPGMSFTNALPMVAFEPGFDPAFLAGLVPVTSSSGITLRTGIVREAAAAPLGRSWYGAAATPLAITALPAEYDPVGWVLGAYPPSPGVSGSALDDYVALRRLSRQAMAFTLVASADLPAYLAEIEARRVAAPPVVGEGDIGVVHVEFTPPDGRMNILVHAPPGVDYLGVYETLDLRNPFPWIPLGTVPHAFDPMAWSYAPSGNRRYVILANHVSDGDQDGIPDALEELYFGTKSGEADSDGDGLGDYAELYIHGSNPLLSSAGGVPDQVRHGLGLTSMDRTRVVEGAVDLRFKTWRVERSKVGFPGFKVAGTFYRSFHGELQINVFNDPSHSTEAVYEGGPWRWDCESNENFPMASGDQRHPFKQTIITKWPLPAMIGTHQGWIAGSDVYPYAGSATPVGDNDDYVQDEVTSTSLIHNVGRLSEEYTDAMLGRETRSDLVHLRTTCDLPEWGGGRMRVFPMSWALDVQTGGYAFDASPLVMSAGSRAERRAIRWVAPGQPPAMTALHVQHMNYQATSADPTLAPDRLLRTVLLEVHRDQPGEGEPAGEITRVAPREVFLKKGGLLWESMPFEMPPPVAEESVEMVDGQVDLSVDGLREDEEYDPGLLISVDQPVTLRLGPFQGKLDLAEYTLEILGPPGGMAPVLRAATAEAFDLEGPIPSDSEHVRYRTPALSPADAANQPFTFSCTTPGVYNVLLKVTGTDGVGQVVDLCALTLYSISVTPPSGQVGTALTIKLEPAGCNWFGADTNVRATGNFHPQPSTLDATSSITLEYASGKIHFDPEHPDEVRLVVGEVMPGAIFFAGNPQLLRAEGGVCKMNLDIHANGRSLEKQFDFTIMPGGSLGTLSGGIFQTCSEFQLGQPLYARIQLKKDGLGNPPEYVAARIISCDGSGAALSSAPENTAERSVLLTLQRNRANEDANFYSYISSPSQEIVPWPYELMPTATTEDRIYVYYVNPGTLKVVYEP